MLNAKVIGSVICALVFAGAVRSADSTPTAEQIAFFEKDVEPLLKTSCFKCHGGEAKVKAGLYLTSRAGMLKGGATGPAIDEKAPAKSLFLDMLSFRDEEHSMPPDGKLKPEQIAVLTKWITSGAEWKPGSEAAPPDAATVKKEPEQKVKTAEDWWAYKALKRPAVPDVKNKAWVTNPIDAFVLAGLEKDGLAPVAPASKIALIRRAYYDLTGLPPTPAEVDAFVANNAPDAYEKLIDTLLASPHYGEKWGRHWLDLVRFAETNGYERDGAKPFAWRYRDYVIRAFNDDKPYDQFIKEQIAGDELDTVTLDSRIATGFYRLNIWDDEPADRKLAKYDVLDGILATTCQAMLGMSMNCARCHNHKKDPILAKDYYSMLAFIQDVSDMHSTDITVDVNSPEQQKVYDSQVQAKTLHEEELMKKIAAIEEEARAAQGAKKQPAAGKDSKDAAVDPLPDARSGAQKWQYTVSKPNNDEWTWQNYNTETWKEGESGFGSKGTPGAVVRTVWRTDDIWLRKLIDLKSVPANLKISLHHDEDCQIYFNGKLAVAFSGFVAKYETHDLNAEALKLLKPGENQIAVHCHQTAGGQYIDLGLVLNADVNPVEEMATSNDGKRMSKEKLAQYNALRKQLDESRRQKVDAGGTRVMAVFERGRTPTKIFMRGNPSLEGDTVTPNFPVILGFPEPVIPAAKGNAPTTGRRRVLAEWLASKNNQLTARAIANRLWQFHFGRGLCRTPNDFGQLGELPTHPELLDWLATEFVGRDWKMKSMHKLIMMSSAYRMSCDDEPKALAKDPNNNLFWRFDMRRLSAEEIRDSILAINGTLNPKMFGPSIYTEVPKEVLASASRPKEAWGFSLPEERTRRSVYILVKRSLNEPILNTFDQADTDSSCPVRFTTTVPTQTLTSLNSKFFNDQAMLLSKRLVKEAGASVEAQVKLGLRLAMGREATAKEIERGVKLIKRFEDEDKVSPEQALADFCLLALNLNEFIYLD